MDLAMRDQSPGKVWDIDQPEMRTPPAFIAGIKTVHATHEPIWHCFGCRAEFTITSSLRRHFVREDATAKQKIRMANCREICGLPADEADVIWKDMLQGGRFVIPGVNVDAVKKANRKADEANSTKRFWTCFNCGYTGTTLHTFRAHLGVAGAAPRGKTVQCRIACGVLLLADGISVDADSLDRKKFYLTRAEFAAIP
jgi:ribosomal protein L37AE/L43A